MSKKILEQAIFAQINADGNKAHDLMRQYVLERARSIFESLRNDDEPALDEDRDGVEYYDEADLTDAEDMGDDDMGDDDVSLDDAENTLSDDMGDEDTTDMDGGDASTDERLDDIEDELDKLAAEFEKIMAEFDGGDENDADDMSDFHSDDTMGDDDMGDDDIDADADMDADLGDVGDEDMDMEDKPMRKLGEGKMPEAFKKNAEKMKAKKKKEVCESDDFDDITESILDELEKVSVPNADGLGDFGTTVRKSFKQGNKSPVPLAKGKPGMTTSKQDAHAGFERENAPKSGNYRGDAPGDNQRTKGKTYVEPAKKPDLYKAELNTTKNGDKPSSSVIAGKVTKK
jgi:hypothetical protein